MQKTLLITGGAGYIGSHTAYTMAQLGYKIIVLDKLIYNQPFNHQWATLIKGDYGDADLLTKIFSLHHIDAVMHFASYIEVGRSVKEPLAFYQNNVAKTVTLLQAMLQHNVKKIIFSSSCAVYGIPHKIPITEDHPKNPISPYGKTKLIIEEMFHDLRISDDLQFVALRYFNAAGVLPHTGLGEYHEPETHLIPLLIAATLNNTPINIFGNSWPTPDGTCVRDYLHVADIATAHAKALHYLDAGNASSCFNLGTGTGFSVAQIITALQKITNIEVSTHDAPPRAGDPAVLVADPSHAQTQLMWQPTHSSLENILHTAWQSTQTMHVASIEHHMQL